jgi:hypothetical protein
MTRIEANGIGMIFADVFRVLADCVALLASPSDKSPGYQTTPDLSGCIGHFK